MVRTMPESMNGINAQLWAETINAFAFIRNSLSTKSCIETKTPYEIIHGSKNNVDRCRVLGCKAFAHVPAQKRAKKFSVKAEEGNLVGYCNGDDY